MVRRLHCIGFEAFMKLIEELKDSTADVYVYFTGTKSEDGGKSWCGDCVEGEAVLEKHLLGLPEDAVFLYVEVGDRDFWKDPFNVFRSNKRINLHVIPTLVKWGTPKRLDGGQCLDYETVEMFFEES